MSSQTFGPSAASASLDFETAHPARGVMEPPKPKPSTTKFETPNAPTPKATLGEQIKTVMVHKDWAQTVREMTDPRYQTTIGKPKKAETTISQGSSYVDRVKGRLVQLRDGHTEFQKFSEKNAPLGQFMKKTGEDVRIGLKRFADSTFGMQQNDGTEEEMLLAASMRKAGLHTEADQMLQEIQDRRLNDMTEREMEDMFSPVSTAERGRRALTQGIAEVLPSLLIAKGAGSRQLAGGALKNFLAENAAESIAFTALRHDYENTPVSAYPKEFFDDYKFIFPMGAAMKVGSKALSASGLAFKSLLTAAKKASVSLSPDMVERGLMGEADETFDAVWKQLTPQEQFALKQEFNNGVSLRESRPVFAKGGQKGIPGMDFPAEPPKPPILAESAQRLGTTPEHLAGVIRKAGTNLDDIEAALRKNYGGAYDQVLVDAQKAVDEGAPIGQMDFADPLRKVIFGDKAMDQNTITALAKQSGGDLKAVDRFGKKSAGMYRDFEIPAGEIDDLLKNPPGQIGELTIDPKSIQNVFDEGGTGIEGKITDPIQVFYDLDTKQYSLQNGYHRLLETIKRGDGQIRAEVTFGRKAAGDSFFVGANHPLVDASALPRGQQGSIPRSDTVKQEFRMDKLNLLPKDEAKVQAVLESLGLTTRGVQTFDEMQEIANQLGTDPESLVRDIKGNKLSAPQVLALRDTINSAVHYLSNKQAMIDDALTPLQKAETLARIAETERLLNDATKKLVKGGTDAGRTVVAYRLIARNTLDPAYWIKEAQSVLGDLDLPPDAITAITSLIRQKDRIGLAHFVAGLKVSTNAEKMVTLWKAGLLTSPTTHLANALSNVTMQSLETVKDVPATLIDWGVSKITGVRTKAMTLQGFVKQGKGVMEGTEHAWEYLKTGIDRDMSLTKYDIPRNVKFNNAYVQMYVDGVFRSLGAVDKISRYAVLKKSLYEQAFVKELNLTPSARALQLEELSQILGTKATRKDLVETFFKNPDEAMSRIAINDAEFVTFTKENQVAKAFRNAKRAGTATRVVLDITVPFVRTPTNVAMAIVEYSPGGFLMAAAKGIRGKGQKEIIESFSRGITGTSIMALGAALGRDGLMTSTMPSDKGERELWEANGIQQQSIFLNGKWRRLDRLSPIGNLLAIGAEFNKIGTERATGDRFVQSAFAGMKGLTEQSFLKGLSAGMRAVMEPDRYAQAFVENAVGGLVPSVLGRIAQGMDTNRRDTDTIMQVVQSRIPVLAEQLPASIDPYGREIKNRQSFFTRVLDPFSSSAPTGDPVAGELFRLQQPMSKPNKGLYNPDEYRKLLQVRGKIMNPLLYATMSSNVYNETYTEDQKKFAVNVMVETASMQAQAIMRQVLAQRLGKELMTLSPADRDTRFQEIQKKDSTTSMMLLQLLGPPPP